MMKNRTSGFTLIEIMIGMAASILLLAVGSVLVSGNKTYHHYALSVRAGETGDAIAELTKTKLQYATNVLIAEEKNWESGDFGMVGFTKDGSFLLDGSEAYGDLPESGLYAGCRITFPDENAPVLQIEVSIKDQAGTMLYRSREVVRLFNMELNGETVDCRIAKRDGAIDSADQDVMLFYWKNGRRYDQDE